MALLSSQEKRSTTILDNSGSLIVKRPIAIMLSLALFLLVLLPVGAAILLIYRASVHGADQIAQTSEKELRKRAFDQLIAVREIKKRQIEEYLNEAIFDTQAFARSRDVARLFTKLNEYHDATGVKPDGPYDVSTPEYMKLRATYGHNIMPYREGRGVHDMFVICAAHGHVMYSSAKEADEGTNLFHGPYKDTGLARLWSKVQATSEGSFVDFAPYAPSNGKPAAFFGVPMRDANGKMTGVLATQLSIDPINTIMQARDGMGETGETYLVGPDRLMRSDSFLDPTNHSVVASFANPTSGSVDTEAADAALKGERGEKVVIDYNGNPVLSAYAPVDLFGTRWALLAEIDEAEAFAAVDQVQQIHNRIVTSLAAWVLGLTGVCLLAIALVALGIHRKIARPIRNMARAATIAANGDLDVHMAAEGKSEVAVLGNALNQMITNLRSVVEQINTAGFQMVSASREQAEGAKSQTVATVEMTTTVTELLASAQNVSESGASASEQSELTAKECTTGTVSVEDAVRGIKSVHERMEKIAAHMLNLGRKSQQISGVLEIITELSEQTNLLSLNASIEAAGAGDAGKRFAVVASEIRKLAERATDSTGEIRSLIDSVQETVNATIMATEEGTKAVQQGVRLTEEVDKSFGRISEQVASTTQLVKAIEMGSRQQATAIAQMEGAVKNVDTAARQTEETARQLDTSAQALLETANRLQGSEEERKVV